LAVDRDLAAPRLAAQHDLVAAEREREFLLLAHADILHIDHERIAFHPRALDRAQSEGRWLALAIEAVEADRSAHPDLGIGGIVRIDIHGVTGPVRERKRNGSDIERIFREAVGLA